MIDPGGKKKESYFNKTISADQSKDTGMAMVLICLLLYYFFQYKTWLVFSMILLLLDMTVPKIYGPAATVWLGLSAILGTLMSKLLLSLIFIILVTPVGILRKIMGKDSLQLKKWKKGTASVFHIREHEFLPEDVEKPY